MTIYDFAEKWQLSLCIIRRPKSDGGYVRFVCYFEDVVASFRGVGKSPEIAMRDYANQIKGKVLVTGRLGPDRKEFSVPFVLTA